MTDFDNGSFFPFEVPAPGLDRTGGSDKPGIGWSAAAENTGGSTTATELSQNLRPGIATLKTALVFPRSCLLDAGLFLEGRPRPRLLTGWLWFTLPSEPDRVYEAGEELPQFSARKIRKLGVLSLSPVVLWPGELPGPATDGR